jgi:hypothetical protein
MEGAKRSLPHPAIATTDKPEIRRASAYGLCRIAASFFFCVDAGSIAPAGRFGLSARLDCAGRPFQCFIVSQPIGHRLESNGISRLRNAVSPLRSILKYSFDDLADSPYTPSQDMSIVYRIDDGVAFVLWDGLVTGDEWLTHVRQLVADPAWPTPRALHLSDLRSAYIDESITQVVLTEAAGLFGSHPRIHQVRAVIVAGDAFGKARIFEDMIARHGGMAFAVNSLRPACSWLGIDHRHAERSIDLLRTMLRDRPGDN